ncbi:hypothetical protein BJ165DRAFT_1008198 [Panaeolus papilionaceus]|nr:hypothetical protein BJ165DRAFT_1008198 [Panaeolus papilionaceus]
MISSLVGRRRAMSSFQKKTKVMDVGWNLEDAIRWMLGFWVIFTVIVPVYGQIQSSRKDLKGNSGEDSCALKHAVEATCSSSPSAQIDNPTPSGCTCNNLYFNIWSSCLLSSGRTTLPTYSNWTLSCKSFGVPMLNNDPVPLGTQIPKWAFLQVPGDTTFDVQAAVLVANPQRWTPLQVALPWCSAVLTLITTVAFIKFWRRPKSGKGLPFSHRIDHSFSSVRFWTPRVKEEPGQLKVVDQEEVQERRNGKIRTRRTFSLIARTVPPFLLSTQFQRIHRSHHLIHRVDSA